MLLNKFEFNPPAIIQYTSGRSELEVQIKFETSPISLSPMEVVKQYMLEEIKAIRETRIMLKNKHQELFSSYGI